MTRIFDAERKIWLVPETAHVALMQENADLRAWRDRLVEENLRVAAERDALHSAHDRLAKAVRAACKPFVSLARKVE